MGSSFMSMMVMIMYAVLGGSDAVQLIDRGAYWQSSGIVAESAALQALLTPAETAAAADPAPWIAKLGAADAADRQAARDWFLAAGPGTLPVLRPLTASEDPEVSASAKTLVATLETVHTTDSDRILRLMAIQELGYVAGTDDTAARALLTTLTTSETPFEAEYAAEALARLAGEPLPTRELPATADIDAMIRYIPPSVTGPINALVRVRAEPAIGVAMWEPDPNAGLDLLAMVSLPMMRKLMTVQLMEPLAAIGNVRIEGLVSAVGGNLAMGPNSGAMPTTVMQWRGDTDAAIQYMLDTGAADVQEETLEGYRAVHWLSMNAYLVVLDETHVLLGTGYDKSYPILPVLRGIKAGEEYPANDELVELLARIPEDAAAGPLRAAMFLPPNMVQQPAFQDFQAVTLGSKMDPEAPATMHLTMTGYGPSADQLQAAKEEVAATIAKQRSEIAGHLQSPRGMLMAGSLQPILTVLESIELASTDDSLTLHVTQTPKSLMSFPAVLMAMPGAGRGQGRPKAKP